jgi:hypothetical protein
MKIAYLILVHRDIELVKKQIETLNSSVVTFFIHLDKKFIFDDIDPFFQKENIIFCKKRYWINWGGFSIINATIQLLSEAISNPIKFDYFILLSGQCFPIKKNREIENFVEINQSIIDIKALPIDKLKNGGLDKLKYWYPFDNLYFIKNDCKKLLFRYFVIFCKIFKISKPLTKDITYCFGSQWWGLNKECVEYILSYCKSNPRFMDFFKFSWAPDELFFQTIIYNSPLYGGIINKPFRYIEWSKQGPPKILSELDYENIINSQFLFARKFDSKKSGNLITKLKSNY